MMRHKVLVLDDDTVQVSIRFFALPTITTTYEYEYVLGKTVIDKL